MVVNDSLEERLSRLEGVDAIRELKARYARITDAKYTSDYCRVDDAAWAAAAQQQAACFTEDAQWYGGTQFGGVLSGRTVLAEWFTRSPWRFAMHYYVAPQIDVMGSDVAEGRWRLLQIGLPFDERRRSCYLRLRSKHIAASARSGSFPACNSKRFISSRSLIRWPPLAARWRRYVRDGCAPKHGRHNRDGRASSV
jgi:hypothetical protein